MRVAFVYDAIYPYVKGGVEKRVYELGRRLAARGHEVHWFGLKWWDGDSVLERGGIVYHGVCRPLPLYTSSGRRSILEALWFSLSLIVPLSRRDDFDLIDCQSFPYFPCFPCRVASWLKGVPLVVTWHEVWGSYWGRYLGFFGFLGRLVERMVSRLTCDNVAVSDTTRDLLVGLGVSESNVVAVSNGVDLEYINSIPPSEKKFDVLFVGRLIKDKNVDVLLRAFSDVISHLPGASMCIVGDGPERSNLVSLASELGLDDAVVFLGFRNDHDDVVSLMKSSKIYVSPSTREGFGLSVLEALSCSVPVLVVDDVLNASDELITDDVNGYVGPLSPGFFSEKIINILSDNKLRNRLSEAAIKSTEKNSWDCVVEKLADYYSNTLS